VYGRPLNATDEVSVDRATGLVAREIMRQRTSSQAHVRTGAQLLGSLLDGAPPDQAHIAERARPRGRRSRRCACHSDRLSRSPTSGRARGRSTRVPAGCGCGAPGLGPR
jgi:hypothetical protein